MGSTIWAAHAAWSPEKEPYEPQQYPPEVLEAVTSPFDDRPGLEPYAAPAPDDYGTYRTFCGT